MSKNNTAAKGDSSNTNAVPASARSEGGGGRVKESDIGKPVKPLNRSEARDDDIRVSGLYVFPIKVRLLAFLTSTKVSPTPGQADHGQHGSSSRPGQPTPPCRSDPLTSLALSPKWPGTYTSLKFLSFVILRPFQSDYPMHLRLDRQPHGDFGAGHKPSLVFRSSWNLCFPLLGPFFLHVSIY